MAGYSGTPLAKKLGIKEGARLAVLGAPKGFAIDDLPPGVEPRTAARGVSDVMVAGICTPDWLSLTARAWYAAISSMSGGVPAAPAPGMPIFCAISWAWRIISS